MAKNKKIKKITAKKVDDDAYLQVLIEDNSGKKIEAKSKILAGGRIKFTIRHPVLKKKFPYDGLIEGSYLYLYPLIGVGVLTDKPIPIK